jgi:ACT domain-containing protein
MSKDKYIPYGLQGKNGMRRMKMNKAIITVVGKDTVGIIAKVCTYLADNQINILDISQTIVQGYFNMMMIVDVGAMTKSFGLVSEELERAGEEIGVKVKIQREDIFTKMHRI